MVVAVLLAAGCGGDDSSSRSTGTTDPVPTSTDEDADSALKTLVGRAVRASESEVVIEGQDGEDVTFTVLAEDAQAVDPGHVQSHVGVPGLAFRVSFYERDGERFAIGAEEVSASELG
ncbi:MAG: hypothetical protein JWM90_521 [Thermoleophilia bacterium]|nr:hypothetical protein [Thermoleophilia bacterium]